MGQCARAYRRLDGAGVGVKRSEEERLRALLDREQDQLRVLVKLAQRASAPAAAPRSPRARFLDRGNLLRPLAHKFAVELQEILRAAGFDNTDDALDRMMTHSIPAAQRITAPVPIKLIAAVADLLAALPGLHGRPRKSSTVEALRLVEQGVSKRRAAKVVAANTGEKPDNVRSALRGGKRRGKRG